MAAAFRKRGFASSWHAWLLLLCAPALGVAADEAHHTFWEVKGKHNTVYLLGSVHMLKPADSTLPPETLQAYAASKGLVMELDLNSLSPDQLLGESTALATLPDGETLAHVLGPQLYAQLQAVAKTNGFDADFLEHMQPWFAALMVEQMELAKSGFEPGAGVDEQFAQLAQTDHKPIIALETLDEQLGIFAHLSLDQQRQYLRSTLEQSSTDASDTQDIVRAWQHGDTATLEQLLREGSSDSPELYRMLTIDRNRKWLPKLEELLRADDNYLVVVGAMHLIGHGGIVELLRKQGYAAIQH